MGSNALLPVFLRVHGQHKELTAIHLGFESDAQFLIAVVRVDGLDERTQFARCILHLHYPAIINYVPPLPVEVTVGNKLLECRMVFMNVIGSHLNISGFQK